MPARRSSAPGSPSSKLARRNGWRACGPIDVRACWSPLPAACQARSAPDLPGVTAASAPDGLTPRVRPGRRTPAVTLGGAQRLDLATHLASYVAPRDVVVHEPAGLHRGVER